MLVKKGTGELVPYDENKVRASILRTGANEKIVDKVIEDIQPHLEDGMSTSKLYHFVYDALEKQSVCHACRYSLREAVFKMGPAGFNFEYYIAAVLREHGYDARVPQEELQGACVSHEVDVVAEKEGRSIFIEAKFRNEKGRVVDLKDTMATWSRFIDLVDGSSLGKCEHFDECWIVTNARFTRHAEQFGECKGMHLTGWKYPKTFSFEQMIDDIRLYPITVVADLSADELERFAKAKMILCKDVAATEAHDLSQMVDISLERAQEVIKKCAEVVGD